ncbi:MFS transporter, partial [Burkholderia metallica]|nr:MFS transporter [Burkholderia metallica]
MSQSSTVSSRMTTPELRATASLAAIFALRMLGLFMIMPVFSVYAKTIPGGDNVLLVGIALGA